MDCNLGQSPSKPVYLISVQVQLLSYGGCEITAKRVSHDGKCLETTNLTPSLKKNRPKEGNDVPRVIDSIQWLPKLGFSPSED